jgi:hypothetical protein
MHQDGGDPCKARLLVYAISSPYHHISAARIAPPLSCVRATASPTAVPRGRARATAREEDPLGRSGRGTAPQHAAVPANRNAAGRRGSRGG